MVDDPEAGFVAADFLAAGRAGWRAPSHATPLEPWVAGAPIPVGEEAMRTAGWQPVTLALQGANGQGSYRRALDSENFPNVNVAGWAESPEYHAAVCRPHEIAILAMRAERKAERDTAWAAERKTVAA